MDEIETQAREFAADNGIDIEPMFEKPVVDPAKYGSASIGVTKKSHEESKTRRKMAAKSRKINRRK